MTLCVQRHRLCGIMEPYWKLGRHGDAERRDAGSHAEHRNEKNAGRLPAVHERAKNLSPVLPRIGRNANSLFFWSGINRY